MTANRAPWMMLGGLTLMWLLLNQTWAPGHIVLGMLLALLMARASLQLRPLRPRIARPWLALLLLARVLRDVIRSNLGVARIVLGLVRDRRISSGFVRIPLDMRDPHGLAVLAAIVTSTPGTVWVDLAVDGTHVTLHVLDLRNEEEWIRWIKDRYEQVLMRIFE